MRPILCQHFLPFHMDVWRLAAVTCVKEEPVGSVSKNGRQFPNRTLVRCSPGSPKRPSSALFFPARELKRLAKIMEERRDEIASSWREHFGR